MFAGHFGLAAGVKSQEPEMPLWALMLSTQLLDVLFVPMYLAGIETTQRVPGAPAYGGLVIHANYTHSLVGALLNSAVAGVVAARAALTYLGFLLLAVPFVGWRLAPVAPALFLLAVAAFGRGEDILHPARWAWLAADGADPVSWTLTAVVLVVGIVAYIAVPRRLDLSSSPE